MVEGRKRLIKYLLGAISMTPGILNVLFNLCKNLTGWDYPYFIDEVIEAQKINLFNVS